MITPASCLRCGRRFQPATAHQALCDDCRLAAKQASYRRERTCADCGKTFVGAPRQKRCPNCQAKVAAERNRAYKRTGPIRPLGSIDTCQRCGRPYTVRSGVQRYCPECSPIANADNERAKKRAQAADQRAAGIPMRHLPHLRICAVCGKPFHATKSTNTCSPACRDALRRQRQRDADKRRRPRRR